MNLSSKNHMWMKWENKIQYQINILQNLAIMRIKIIKQNIFF